MKKETIYSMCITICIGYGIICPDLLAKSAANGFISVVSFDIADVKLPFGILSGIILRTGMYDTILNGSVRF